MQWSMEVDVLVIGGGGAGLGAAIAAAEEGATVAIAEKWDRLGGNTALSTGSVPGAGTRFQRAAGIADSPERFAQDILRRTNNTAPKHLVQALARESGPLVEWLVDSADAPLRFEPVLKKIGHSVPRTHVAEGRSGEALFSSLERRARALGVEISVGTPALGLIAEEGRIVGARISSGSGDAVDNIRARKVVLATNGFGGNRDMLREFCPEIADAPYFGHQGNTGEGILWGRALGARLHNMSSYQGHASVSVPHGALVSWSVIELGGILVNAAGERFADELAGYSGCAAEVLSQPDAAAAVIFDERIHRYMRDNVPEYARLDDMKGVRHAEVPDELLGRLGFGSKTSLAETLASYARVRAAGNDRFGRTEFGPQPLQAPFYGVRVTAGLFHTQGGLYVNEHAQPIDEAGQPFPNLYAAGGTAVGLAGRDGGRGYCSASGLLAALGLGRIAGRHAGKACCAGTDH